MQNCPTSEYRRCPPGNSCMAIDVLNCHACGDACGENETCAYNPYSPLHYSSRCLPGYGTGTDGICVQFGTRRNTAKASPAPRARRVINAC